MKPFQVQSNNTILIKDIAYNIEEIDKSTLSTSGNSTVTTTSNSIINNIKGVYIFVLDRSISNFSKNHFDREVTGVFFKRNCPYTKEVGVPPFIEAPKPNCIFYVGRAGQIVSRLKEHWNNDKINGCTSLKLGFTTRKWIKEFLKVYVITSICDSMYAFDYKQLEKDIRAEYGSAFGK